MTPDTFWTKVDAGGDCWIWLGAQAGRPGEKYGQLRFGDRHDQAHRVAYVLLVGPIPAGMVLDHLCRNHLCVNPDHLEPVTPRTNALRGYGAAARGARQTVCIRGHAFTQFIKRGRVQRQCLACRRLLEKAYRAKAAA